MIIAVEVLPEICMSIHFCFGTDQAIVEKGGYYLCSNLCFCSYDITSLRPLNCFHGF